MTTNIENYSDYCCGCFTKSQNLTSLQSDLNKEKTIYEVFFEITGIEISMSDSSEFNKNICSDCLQQLKNAFSFREMCLETRKKFFGLLENQVDQSIAVENTKDESVGDKVGQEECSEAHQFTSSPLTKEFVSQKTSPKNHSRKYPKISCKATKLSPQKVLLNRGHKRIGHKIEEETSETGTNYLCSTCGKSFKTRQRLQNHIITHTGEKKFSCSICSKRFAIANSLKNHMRIHTGDKPYKCSTCGLCFSQRNVLVCHSRLHTGEKPFTCEICQKKFRQNATLKTHMAIHTGKSIECPDCKKTFSRMSFLHVHRRKHTGEKPYACDRCPNRYRQKCHLAQHMDTHDGVKYQCLICKKDYSKKWSLKIHMISIHSDGSRFKCDCGLSFVRRDKYRKHMKIVHGKDIDTER
ncbi:zinc finger protein 501-like isoform X2 [Phlebotomus papatasi]|uniref:zinc finger protein 501-like isoform X2 n=1 Tax=Phlebotomus papatasi TaxID=29031 RepID=UPI0024835EAF|nr:zinc finger protein 501-like isoform X2 [Phlebotomus papatasi]